MISVLTRVDTSGAHEELFLEIKGVTSNVFVDELYTSIKEAHKEGGISTEQIASLADLLTELASRLKESGE